MNKLLKKRGFGKVLVAGVAAVVMAGAPLAASAYGWHGGYRGGWQGGWGRPVVVHRGPGFGAVVGGALIAGATVGLVASALSPAPVYAAPAPTVVYTQPQTVVYEGVPPPVTTTTTTTYYTR